MRVRLPWSFILEFDISNDTLVVDEAGFGKRLLFGFRYDFDREQVKLPSAV
jgi:hypothetical protein